MLLSPAARSAVHCGTSSWKPRVDDCVLGRAPGGMPANGGKKRSVLSEAVMSNKPEVFMGGHPLRQPESNVFC